MRVVVDLAVCQGYAQCAFLAPEAFRLSGPEGLMYNPGPPGRLREQVLRAVAACPVKAISADALPGDTVPGDTATRDAR
jgi:ferredoxin